MFKHIPKLKMWGRNKYQIYVSFLITLVGASNFFGVPRGYETSLIAAGGFVTGLLCALNAILDAKRMNCVERVLSTVRFIFLLIVTPLVLWNIATWGEFADR